MKEKYSNHRVKKTADRQDSTPESGKSLIIPAG
jgi:hypothetical protein